MPTNRLLKKNIAALLASGPVRLEDLLALGTARQVINPLFGLLYDGRPVVKWRAVRAMGLVTSHLASVDLESARVIMRRLMWNLNDESGGIGWGSPEAMGEITARSRRLAAEYGCLLVSYINPAENYLEHPVLQRGSLWGLGRLLNRRPEYASDAADHLPSFLTGTDPHHKALAAWTAGPLKAESLRPLLKALEPDHRTVELFLEGRLQKVTVGKMAQDALSKYPC